MIWTSDLPCNWPWKENSQLLSGAILLDTQCIVKATVRMSILSAKNFALWITHELPCPFNHGQTLHVWILITVQQCVKPTEDCKHSMCIWMHKRPHYKRALPHFLYLSLALTDSVRNQVLLDVRLYKGISHLLLVLIVAQLCSVTTVERPCNWIYSRFWEKKKWYK